MGACGRFTPAEMLAFLLALSIVGVWVMTGHWLLMDGEILCQESIKYRIEIMPKFFIIEIIQDYSFRIKEAPSIHDSMKQMGLMGAIN